MDDIFLTRNIYIVLMLFSKLLFNKLNLGFAIKNFGSLHDFYGVEVKPFPGEINILVPTQYTCDIVYEILL